MPKIPYDALGFFLPFIMFSDALPKTRSGKIMRRVLKAIALMGDSGNMMILANPEVVQTLVDERAKLGEIKF